MISSIVYLAPMKIRYRSIDGKYAELIVVEPQAKFRSGHALLLVLPPGRSENGKIARNFAEHGFTVGLLELHTKYKETALGRIDAALSALGSSNKGIIRIVACFLESSLYPELHEALKPLADQIDEVVTCVAHGQGFQVVTKAINGAVAAQHQINADAGGGRDRRIAVARILASQMSTASGEAVIRQSNIEAENFEEYLPWILLIGFGAILRECLKLITHGGFSISSNRPQIRILSGIFLGISILIVGASFRYGSYLVSTTKNLQAAVIRVLGTYEEEIAALATELAPTVSSASLMSSCELLDHAIYVNRLGHTIKHQYDQTLFSDYVVDPVLAKPAVLSSWRGPLWRSIGGHVPVVDDPEFAVDQVHLKLLQRVSIREADISSDTDPLVIWRRGYATPAEFCVLLVAALRSAGIPTRMASNERVEVFHSGEWHMLLPAVEIR